MYKVPLSMREGQSEGHQQVRKNEAWWCISVTPALGAEAGDSHGACWLPVQQE